MIDKLRNERVVHLAITAPPVNVLDAAILRELVEDLGELASDDSLAAVVLSGEGRCFSAGASVVEHKQALAKSLTEGCAERLDSFKAVFISELYRLEDVAEGIKSFEERRAPEWKHR